MKKVDAPSDQLQQVASNMVRPLMLFPATLPKTADVHYTPANVKIGDSSRPIFWYVPMNGSKYRIVYADFSVGEVSVAPKIDGAIKLTK